MDTITDRYRTRNRNLRNPVRPRIERFSKVFDHWIPLDYSQDMFYIYIYFCNYNLSNYLSSNSIYPNYPKESKSYQLKTILKIKFLHSVEYVIDD